VFHAAVQSIYLPWQIDRDREREREREMALFVLPCPRKPREVDVA
jgi:hypothetical protein